MANPCLGSSLQAFRALRERGLIRTSTSKDYLLCGLSVIFLQRRPCLLIGTSEPQSGEADGLGPILGSDLSCSQSVIYERYESGSSCCGFGVGVAMRAEIAVERRVGSVEDQMAILTFAQVALDLVFNRGRELAL